MEENKVAVVTGATTGIGKEIALELSKNGYNIAINYRSETADMEDLKKEIEQNNVKCIFVKADVSNFEETENMVKEIVNEYGKIDVLVNNAGITQDGLIMRMKKESFDQVVDINLGGTFNVTRNVVPFMVKQRSGRIINVSSVVGIVGNAGQSNYAASKAGIIGFTKSLAKELSSRGILVNAIAPGFIETKMTDKLNENVRQSILNQIPLGRMGEPKEVAKVVKFLSSDDSSYITGQVINIDGGMVI